MPFFNVLYTSQKQKKAKTWHDGILEEIDSSKRFIYDEKRTKIDILFSNRTVSVGDEYETDKHLILVDSVRGLATQAANQQMPSISLEQDPYTSALPKQNFPSRRTGLSRKGFNAPKRIPITHEEAVPQPSRSPPCQQVPDRISLFSSYLHGDDDNEIKYPKATSNMVGERGYQVGSISDRTLGNISPPKLRNPGNLWNDFMSQPDNNSLDTTINQSSWEQKENKAISDDQSLTELDDATNKSSRNSFRKRLGDDVINRQSNCLTPDVSHFTSALSSNSDALSEAKRAKIAIDTTSKIQRLTNRGSVSLWSNQINVIGGSDDENIPNTARDYEKFSILQKLESPQTACFSVGSLPSFTESDLSQPTESPVHKQINGKFEQQSSEAVEIGSPVSSLPSLDNSMAEYNVLKSRRNNRLHDFLKNSSDENDSSLFELEDSTGSIHRKPEISFDPSRNRWMVFASPARNESQIKSRSIYDGIAEGLPGETAHDSPPANVPTSIQIKESPIPHSPSSSHRFVSESGSNHTDDLVKKGYGFSASTLRQTEVPNVRVAQYKPSVDSWTLRFPPYIVNPNKPARVMVIPQSFKNTLEYRQILEQVLKEHINILLLELSTRYHQSLAQVDISDPELLYSSNIGKKAENDNNSNAPKCKHGVPARIEVVKKDGTNKGKMFYCCSFPRNTQCQYFEWVNGVTKLANKTGQGRQQLVLSSPKAVETYMKSVEIMFYCSVILKRTSNAFTSKQQWADSTPDQFLFLRLSRKEKSSSYTKDDLWVVSQNLKFDLSGHTFLAKSAFYGPNSENELKLLPIAGYTSSDWSDAMMCHAIHAVNLSTELTCLSNISDLSARNVPVLPWILHSSGPERTGSKFEIPKTKPDGLIIAENQVMELLSSYKKKYPLNRGQRAALDSIANMFISSESKPICLVKGVFGAGKSYLLSVMVEFLAGILQLVDSSSEINTSDVAHSKVLIASLTNVAVDRILLSLMDHGFTDFVRVGSIKKIAKPVLPYSLHASGNDNAELKELKEILSDPGISDQERISVKKALDQQKLGINKQRLARSRVVGVTCAACWLPALNNMTFKVVLLDECSQMTEPVSLLPIKRAQCHRVVLVGDPKQLNPTIQSSESLHAQGLEQTMFDRLSHLNIPTTHLTTQYRCHPRISALCNRLFYDEVLEDGVTEDIRAPLIEDLPTICLYDVPGKQIISNDSSFKNEKEAIFVSKLVSYLLHEEVREEQIGIITLYKAQASYISSLLAGKCKVQVATVDSFQGGEKDVIILSCVRTDQMGFVDDVRRTNVALSRGKFHLLIVGHAENLKRNDLWSHVISYLNELPSGVISASTMLEKWNQINLEASEASPQFKISKAEPPMEPKAKVHRLASDSGPAGDLVDIELVSGEERISDHSLPLDLSDEEFLTSYQKIKDFI